jgi:adenylate cyclase
MVYRFGVFSLDERSRRLRRGAQSLQMRSKCFDALAFLVHNANTTVTKSQIIDALWPDRDVDEASLTQIVYELRKHLGDVNGDMIVTLPSVGYRFTPHVDAAPADSRFERYFEPVDTYELYAKGKYLLEKRGKTEFMQALQLFQRAVEESPSYALAYLGLAQAWNALGTYIYVEPKIAFPNGRAAAQRALELDPNLPEAYSLLAEGALFFDRDWESTARFASAAVAMNPSLQMPRHTLAWLHIAMGDLDEAAKIVIRTIEMFPASLNLHTTLALIYRYRGEVEKSIALFRGILEMDATYNLARYYLGNSLVVQGPIEEAIAELDRVAAVEPTVQVRSSLAYALARGGDRRTAEEILESLQAQATTEYVSRYSLALINVGLHNFERAMDELHHAIAERAAWLIFLGVEPRFDVMRSRADFQGLLVELGLRKAA